MAFNATGTMSDGCLQVYGSSTIYAPRVLDNSASFTV